MFIVFTSKLTGRPIAIRREDVKYVFFDADGVLNIGQANMPGLPIEGTFEETVALLNGRTPASDEDGYMAHNGSPISPCQPAVNVAVKFTDGTWCTGQSQDFQWCNVARWRLARVDTTGWTVRRVGDPSMPCDADATVDVRYGANGPATQSDRATADAIDWQFVSAWRYAV
jgi:hypothetical protein